MRLAAGAATLVAVVRKRGGAGKPALDNKGGCTLMQRIITLVVVALVMAAMMVAMAMPAFANNHHGCKPGSQGFKSSHHECRHKG